MPIAIHAPAANADLQEIAYQIGVKDGRPLAADKIVDELIGCCNELASLSSISRLGTSLPQVGIGVRAFSYKRWVILFRYVEEGILVLRFADGSRDYLSWALN